MNRRDFLKLTGVGAASVALAACGANNAETPSAAGSAVGGGDLIRIGFIPLTDCASVVMAAQLGLFKQYGLNVEVTKEASWANVRDKLLTGELHAAHCLFGMPFSVYTGVGGAAEQELKIAMMLNANGQAITLAKGLAATAGYGDIKNVAAAVDSLRAAKTP